MQDGIYTELAGIAGWELAIDSAVALGANSVSESAANQRRTVYYSGHVQGVGFRYTASAKAQRYDVTGFVENLDDGRVRLVVEGRPEEIDKFLADVAETMQQFIRRADVSQSPASGEFSRFEIQRY